MTTPYRAAATPRLLALALALGLTACADPAPTTPPTSAAPPTPTAPAAPTLPPRPGELPVAGLDPCTLLTPTHQHQLGVHQIGLGADDDTQGGQACDWSNDPRKPDDAYRVGVNTAHGAEWALTSRPRQQIVQIDGYPAVQTYGGLGNPEEQCILWIDVAAGQSLVVDYENHLFKDPAMNRTLACQRAHTAAGLVLHTLRATPR